MEEKIKRALYMLMVVNNLLTKQKDSHYVLNMLEETTDYGGGVKCDGQCILDDIEYCLSEFGIFPDEDASYIDYNIFNIPESPAEVEIDEKRRFG